MICQNRLYGDSRVPSVANLIELLFFSTEECFTFFAVKLGHFSIKGFHM